MTISLATLMGRSPASIQTVEVTRGLSANTYNIAAVNTAKSIVLYPGLAQQYSTTNAVIAVAKLASATQITVPPALDGGQVKFTVQVVDFGGMARSVQSGTATAETVSIANVNIEKCVLMYARQRMAVTSNATYTAKLSASSITFSGGVSTNYPVEWQLVEFW